MLTLVPEDSPEKRRGRTVFLPPWWAASVERALVRLGIDQKELAAAIKLDETRVSRCISNKVPTLGVIEAISAYLKIPMPVVFPQSEAEALAIDGTRRLFGTDAQAMGIVAGVGDGAQSGQTDDVEPEHADSRSRRGKPR